MKKVQKKNNFLKTIPFSRIYFILSILFVVSLPFFIGNIIWEAPSNILGTKINYLHLRVTLHSLISLALLGVYFIKIWENKKVLRFATQIAGIFIALAIYSGIRTVKTAEPFSSEQYQFGIVSFVKSLFFFINISTFLLATQELFREKKKQSELIYIYMAVAISLQLLLGIAQVISEGPIFSNFLSWSGQPLVFNSHTYIGTSIFMRAYGTTPHPNILGGITSFLLFVLLSLNISKVKKITVGILAMILIGLTLSRSATFAGILVIIAFLLRKKITKLKITPKTFWISTTVLQIILFTAFSLISMKDNFGSFVISRVLIQKAYTALLTIHPKNLLLGTGMFMSIPALLTNWISLGTPLTYINRILAEPPHNALLLLIVEWGVAIAGGITAMIGIGIQSFLNKLQPWQILAIFALLNVLGGVDHYLVY